MTNAPTIALDPSVAELTPEQKDALLIKCYETLILARQCHDYQKKIIAGAGRRTAVLMLVAFAIGAYIGGAL